MSAVWPNSATNSWATRALLGLTTVTFLAACQPIEVKQAKGLVEDQLTDPSSAQYKSLAVITMTKDAVYPFTPGMKVVCGQVNAKNRMGGYVGLKAFYAIPSRKLAIIQPNFPEGKTNLFDLNESEWQDFQASRLFQKGFEAACLKGGAVDLG